MSRHEVAIDAVASAVLAGGDATRRAAFDGAPIPGVVGAFVDKVRYHSVRVGDSDIDALRAAGLDEDAILEVTLAAAVGAAMEQWRAARDS